MSLFVTRSLWKVKEQYKALGAISKKEKQGIIIVAIAIILWITQKLHGVDAGFVAIAADAIFILLKNLK